MAMLRVYGSSSGSSRNPPVLSLWELRKVWLRVDSADGCRVERNMTVVTPPGEGELVVDCCLGDDVSADDDWPIVISWEEIGDLLRNEFEVYDFYPGENWLDPRDWPIIPESQCLCGHDIEPGEVYYRICYGEAGRKIDRSWVEWEIRLHPHCVPGFFELITGGAFFEDHNDYLSRRDVPA